VYNYLSMGRSLAGRIIKVCPGTDRMTMKAQRLAEGSIGKRSVRADVLAVGTGTYAWTLWLEMKVSLLRVDKQGIRMNVCS
jgi:hypothetical protein